MPLTMNYSGPRVLGATKRRSLSAVQIKSENFTKFILFKIETNFL
jgi:hypothetical protein